MPKMDPFGRKFLVPQFVETLPNGRSYRILEVLGDNGAADNTRVFSVPRGHYFMMGDNRDNSEASRFWGPLPASYIKGKAMMIYWSYEGNQPLIAQTGLRATIRRIGSTIINFFSGTRWNRMFHQLG